MKITLGLAQIAPKLGDVPANLDKHLSVIAQAADQGAQVVVFPELSLTGYNLQDLIYDVAARPTPDNPVFGPLLDASRARDIDVIVGFVEENHRHCFTNTQAYLSRGDVIHIHRKVYLPNQGMFDEARHFARGDAVRAFETRFGRAGMAICRDFWHASLPYLLWLDGAELLFFHSASPGRGLGEDEAMSSFRRLERLNQVYASTFGVIIAHCNRAGFEGGMAFGGGSTITGPGGDFLAQAPYFEETLLVHTVDLGEIRRARIALPMLRDERPDLVMRELARILGGT